MKILFSITEKESYLVNEMLAAFKRKNSRFGGSALNSGQVGSFRKVPSSKELPDAFKNLKETAAKGFKVEKFEHSVKVRSSKSDLRIQIQTDTRYQGFLFRASSKEVLGYKMNVSSLEDVLLGKVWAYLEERRRKSKRQKDLTDIMCLMEAHPFPEDRIPTKILRKCSSPHKQHRMRTNQPFMDLFDICPAL